MRIFKKLKHVIFLVKLACYYTIFKASRDLRQHHVVNKDASEYASYLEAVYNCKIEKLLKEESDRFFGESE